MTKPDSTDAAGVYLRSKNPRDVTLDEWKTRARQAEALAWRRYKTIKKLRAELRNLRAKL